MSFEIKYENKSKRKEFDSVLDRYSEDIQKRAIKHLSETPYNSKKIGQLRKYDLPDAYRIVYTIPKVSKDAPKIVNIVGAGDHSYYDRLLKKYAK
ncbi:hypothetical protein HYU92_00565 [Candidatus Curtissbacteria bacterium]|nr:hypothetical protein [Candidatus Curtissbacteria bacterium]